MPSISCEYRIITNKHLILRYFNEVYTHCQDLNLFVQSCYKLRNMKHVEIRSALYILAMHLQHILCVSSIILRTNHCCPLISVSSFKTIFLSWFLCCFVKWSWFHMTFLSSFAYRFHSLSQNINSINIENG